MREKQPLTVGEVVARLTGLRLESVVCLGAKMIFRDGNVLENRDNCAIVLHFNDGSEISLYDPVCVDLADPPDPSLPLPDGKDRWPLRREQVEGYWKWLEECRDKGTGAMLGAPGIGLVIAAIEHERREKQEAKDEAKALLEKATELHQQLEEIKGSRLQATIDRYEAVVAALKKLNDICLDSSHGEPTQPPCLLEKGHIGLHWNNVGVWG